MKKLLLILLMMVIGAKAQQFPAFLLYDANGNPFPTGSGTSLTYSPPPFTCYTISAGSVVPCVFTGGGSGTVTSVTFTGDGIVDSSTPSSAVTTSGTVTATLNTQSANTAFGNFTGSTALPSFTATTGTGSPVAATSPTLVTPALGTPSALVISNATGTCTACTANAVGAALTMNNIGSGAASGTTFNGSSAQTLSFNTLGAGGIAAANTWTAANIFNVNGAASTSTVLVNGSWFTGGSASTTYPGLYVKGSGATDGNLSTLGNGLVVNGASGFAGFFMLAQLNGASPVFRVDATGNMLTTGNLSGPSSVTSKLYDTTTNCAGVGTAASPSVVSCTAAPAGAFSCATNASAATCTINTTAVTANSEIIVIANTTEGTRLSVTCNTAPTAPPAIVVASKTGGTGFTINLPTFSTNPVCYDYWVVN